MNVDQLDNCRLCGNIYLKNFTDYCPACSLEVEEEYKSVAEYLKNELNSFVTLEEVSKETGVSVKRITDFIRDGRIYAEDHPNLGYPCAHCPKLIKKQLLCKDCFDRFSSDLDHTLKRKSLENERKQHMYASSKESKYWRVKK